jgi:hypothetical protein
MAMCYGPEESAMVRGVHCLVRQVLGPAAAPSRSRSTMSISLMGSTPVHAEACAVSNAAGGMPGSAHVTRQVVQALSTLASSLERRGQSRDAVTTFLIRGVIGLFARDIGPLPTVTSPASAETIAEDPDELLSLLDGQWRGMPSDGDACLVVTLPPEEEDALRRVAAADCSA